MYQSAEQAPETRTPEEQHPTCPRTLTMSFGENDFVLFSSIN